jgi:hypothetical protein
MMVIYEHPVNDAADCSPTFGSLCNFDRLWKSNNFIRQMTALHECVVHTASGCTMSR